MVKFSDKITYRGSNQITVNVDRDGHPFGQIWTFRDTRSTKSPWHVKAEDGSFTHFYAEKKADALAQAKAWIAAKA